MKIQQKNLPEKLKCVKKFRQKKSSKKSKVIEMLLNNYILIQESCQKKSSKNLSEKNGQILKNLRKNTK